MSNLKFPLLFFLLLFAYCCNAQNSSFALSSDNTAIFYRVYGTGKPLLIINGGPGMNSDGFENLAIKLSKNYQAIIYDQRGTGKSVLKLIDTTTITMKLMVDDIESIRKQLNIKSWSVLGHSFGGMLASYYASQYPEAIEKIILSSSGGIDLDLLNYVQESINSRLGKTNLDSLTYWNNKISDGDTSYFAKFQRGKYLAHAYIVDNKYIPIIAERLTQGNSVINQLIWTDMQKINFDCASDLKTFVKPVLIIQGKQDIIKSETAEKAHKAFINSRIVYLEHSAHYGWLDNEESYFKELNSFLTGSN